MPEPWQISQWLRDGQQDEAATLIEQCALDFEYVDTAFELSGDREFDIYEVVIRAPRRVLESEQRELHSKAIQDALTACCEADGLYVRDIRWGAIVPSQQHTPAASQITGALSALNAAHIHEIWQKALERKTADPEGAITSARTLLESVCKSILDGRAAAYDDASDLPKLYNLTARELNLAPSQHTEEVFRQILGGCFAVVNGLGTVRNRLSDAHGKGQTPVRPSVRHAELAINLAGAVALFLVATASAKLTPSQ